MYTTLCLANQIQKAFRFDFYPEVLPVADILKLPNGGYDLFEAPRMLSKSRKYKALPRPLILLSSLPFGDREYENERDWFFFSSEFPDDAKSSIMSTYPLELLSARVLQDYLLLLLASFLFDKYADLGYHNETHVAR